MDRRLKVMIVEDDEGLSREIGLFLERWKYEAVQVKQFDDVLLKFMESRPQLVLLDVNLPFYDGFYWCSRIRQVCDVPIIFISSRGDDRDKIMAIAQGGDDYVEKPFHLELLKAKIEAILRRTYQYKVREQIFLNERLCFDCTGKRIYFKGEEIELTKQERKMMSKLTECRTNVVTREELMMALWDTDEYVSDGALTTVISRLRDKLKGICGEEIIQTKKGQGYFIR